MATDTMADGTSWTGSVQAGGTNKTITLPTSGKYVDRDIVITVEPPSAGTIAPIPVSNATIGTGSGVTVNAKATTAGYVNENAIGQPIEITEVTLTNSKEFTINCGASADKFKFSVDESGNVTISEGQ